MAYNPEGELGGMFAPPHIAGDPVANAAVQKWMGENWGAVTNANIDQTRMPMPIGGSGESRSVPYGGTIANTQAFGDKRGALDPEALRVLAQGGKYDMAGRRNAIAAQLVANNAPTPSATPATDTPQQMPEWYTQRSLAGW